MGRAERLSVAQSPALVAQATNGLSLHSSAGACSASDLGDPLNPQLRVALAEGDSMLSSLWTKALASTEQLNEIAESMMRRLDALLRSA